MTQLTQLATIAQKEFDIEISIEKMLSDVSYRQLVISELAQLTHHEITQIITWLATTTSPKLQSASTEPTTTKKTPLLLILTATLALIIAASIFWYTTILTPSLTPEPDTHVNIVSPIATEKNSSKTKHPPAVQPKIETVFRLHGSNTIGEKLAPLLLEGFLQQQGINDFNWTQSSPLERVIHYRNDDKHYAIELKSHGSSTAFSGLESKTANIGMSSRRVKDTEVNALKNITGHLNKLGNEHIIGLDGLAVIVNQNNSVKQLTSETLAKIFSGEINNWSQIGGANLPIILYARDEHSGTWDTFKNLVLKKHNKKLSNTAKRFESSSTLSTLVSQNEAAIGFIGLNYVSHNKALAIAESKGTNAIFPTRFTVGTEDYALSRRLYFYTPTSASSMVKDFAQYALSTQGQQVVSNAGLISQNIKLEQVYPLQGAPERYQYYTKAAKRLSLNFRFDYATQDLDNKGKRDLLRLVEFMEEHQNNRIVLMGFSDSIGAVARNTNLSLRRAKSVEQALIARGIPVFAVEGMGEALPIANNDTEDGRKRNRRVEVWLL
ncbi:phosphate ABC transporter substrate-binding/OmpA family protein [Colwellia sp. E2M01]|nr:phosphate ABC transporter substrate-binding/OmpA family protein [Colwellia sp. E2M01]